VDEASEDERGQGEAVVAAGAPHVIPEASGTPEI
jgi:hypothetical protein